MIIRIRTTKGISFTLTANHIVLHEEEGSDGWIDVYGMRQSALHLDTCYMIKGLTSVSVYDHGRVIWSKSFEQERLDKKPDAISQSMLDACSTCKVDGQDGSCLLGLSDCKWY